MIPDERPRVQALAVSHQRIAATATALQIVARYTHAARKRDTRRVMVSPIGWTRTRTQLPLPCLP